MSRIERNIEGLEDWANSKRINDLEQQLDALRASLEELSTRAPRIADISSPTFPNDMIGFPVKSAGAATPVSANDTRQKTSEFAATVRARIRQRRVRESLFSNDLFADPAWDMLLDLYAAELEGVDVSVSSLCIAAAVPTTTALRWIKLLSQRGWLVRHHDPKDGRRIIMRLSNDARSRLDRYFEQITK